MSARKKKTASGASRPGVRGTVWKDFDRAIDRANRKLIVSARKKKTPARTDVAQVLSARFPKIGDTISLLVIQRDGLGTIAIVDECFLLTPVLARQLATWFADAADENAPLDWDAAAALDLWMLCAIRDRVPAFGLFPTPAHARSFERLKTLEAIGVSAEKTFEITKYGESLLKSLGESTTPQPREPLGALGALEAMKRIRGVR